MSKEKTKILIIDSGEEVGSLLEILREKLSDQYEFEKIESLDFNTKDNNLKKYILELEVENLKNNKILKQSITEEKYYSKYTKSYNKKHKSKI